MPNLYVDLELAMSSEVLPHCEAAIDYYLGFLSLDGSEISESVRAELENVRNTFRAMDQQVRAGHRRAVNLTVDPLLR